jgi:hypothetical protein
MNPKWNIGKSVATAVQMIVANRVSVNWIVVQAPIGQALHEDYPLDTMAKDQCIDSFFRMRVADGLSDVPTPMKKPLVRIKSSTLDLLTYDTTRGDCLTICPNQRMSRLSLLHPPSFRML